MLGHPRATAEVIAGRYQVERLLGTGGMGEVYSVVDNASGERLALKRLRKEAGRTASALFEREFRTLRSLHHPLIVRAFDYGIDESGAFYTMELLEGNELTGAAPMSWRETCACLRDAASILGVLHARRLVHRDLSPRNLWRTPQGQIKLLDFGALAPFGTSSEIVGTAPYVAPEVLDGRPLDQRTDLYALGALGYWLLTSTHAYRASSLADLPKLWERAPARPSSLVKHLTGVEGDIPEELDTLVMALLSRDPSQRPATTVDVIDTLNSIADLAPESELLVIQGYLQSKEFVGRKREKARFSSRLALAQAGRPQTLFVEGAEGIGRTRLVEELSTLAHIAGAVVLSTGATESQRPYGAATALGRMLLNALPEEALQAAGEDGPVLARLSPELRAALHVESSALELSDPGAERAVRQTALFNWFVKLARRRTLVVLIDDMHLLDEESQAFFGTLRHADQGSRVLVLATARADADLVSTAALQSFRASAHRLRLLPLDPSQTLELLRSVFGDVAYLERLAARLHAISEGNPRHCLMLAEHLAYTGAARYAEGAWALPTDLPESGLPRSLKAGLLARIERLEPKERELARLLSIPDHGSFTLAMCAALLGCDTSTVRPVVQSLVQREILRERDRGLQLAHPSLREALYAELPSHERVRVHRTLAILLERAAAHDHLQELRASLHFFRAGDVEQGELLLLRAGRHHTRAVVEGLRAAAPMHEDALTCLRAARRPASSMFVPLQGLAAAGYFVDQRYAARYGEQAVVELERALHLKLARRLRPWVGARLALIFALVVAGVRLRSNPRALSVAETVRNLLASVASLVGTAAACLDAKTADRFTAVIEPLTALGKEHAATLVHRFCVALALGAAERTAEAHKLLASLITWLQRGTPIKGLPDEIRQSYLAGSYFAMAVREAFRCGDGALDLSDQLERCGPLHAMQADHVRAVYYASRGDLERAAHFRSRVERQSIQLGNAWQAETWAPAEASKTAFWTHDPVAMKRAARELSRLASEFPSFGFYERSTRAAYLVERGRYAEAVAVIGRPDTEDTCVGWARCCGILACAYNGLGEHEQARSVCLAALTRLTPNDLEFVNATLNVQVELALADAGLGHSDDAKRRLDALLARYGTENWPLLEGYLHHARSRVAQLEGDLAGARRHLELMECCYASTRIPSLTAFTEQAKHRFERALHPEDEAAPGVLVERDAHLLTRVQLLMTNAGRLKTERAERGLQIAIEISGADRGFIMLHEEAKVAAQIGDQTLEPELISWAAQRMAAMGAEDQTAVLSPSEALTDSNVRVSGKTRWCISLLKALRENSEVPIAALVLGFERGAPTLPAYPILEVIAGRLTRPDEEQDSEDHLCPSTAGG